MCRVGAGFDWGHIRGAGAGAGVGLPHESGQGSGDDAHKVVAAGLQHIQDVGPEGVAIFLQESSDIVHNLRKAEGREGGKGTGEERKNREGGGASASIVAPGSLTTTKIEV